MPGDTGECPDRERALSSKIQLLENTISKLKNENNALTAEKMSLSVELQNLKASQTGGPDEPADEAHESQGDISTDAARKRLFRLMKQGSDGHLAD